MGCKILLTQEQNQACLQLASKGRHKRSDDRVLALALHTHVCVCACTRVLFIMLHWGNVPPLPSSLDTKHAHTLCSSPPPTHHTLCHRDPIILPFFHSGMSRVMPFKSSLPRVGQTVVVAVGQPLDLSHITCRCNQPGA